MIEFINGNEILSNNKNDIDLCHSKYLLMHYLGKDFLLSKKKDPDKDYELPDGVLKAFKDSWGVD